jgi:hypothetical protein
MSNYIEELTEEYFKIKGYFVMRNYWFPFVSPRKRIQNEQKQSYAAQSWSDLDVIAIDDDEILLIQTKTVLNTPEVANKIVGYFVRAEEYLAQGLALDGSSNVEWWTQDRDVRKILIYESGIKSYIKLVADNNIEILSIKQVVSELLDYARNKKGDKEGNSSMRFLRFLDREGFLTEPKKALPLHAVKA